MSDPFIWSHTSGSREELAMALTCETALKSNKTISHIFVFQINSGDHKIFSAVVKTNAAGGDSPSDVIF